MTGPKWLFYAAWLSICLVASSCTGPVVPQQPATEPSDRWISEDAEYARLMTAGRVAFERGLADQAAGLYEQALRRARLMDAAAAIGDAAFNLAACRMRLGELDQAQVLLDEAKAEITSIRGNTADIQLVQAKLARLKGNEDSALMITEQILSGAGSDPGYVQRLEAHLLRGQIACDRGDPALAERELQSAEAHAGKAANPALTAGLSGLRGRILLLKERPAEAAPAFDRQASLLRLAENYDQMTHALESAADAYRRAGDQGLAADRFFRAARSLFAQGEMAGALRLAQQSLAAAEAAGERPAIARARGLLSELEERPAGK